MDITYIHNTEYWGNVHTFQHKVNPHFNTCQCYVFMVFTILLKKQTSLTNYI